MRVLFTGNVGESLPPPYAGIPKRALLLGRAMREAGHTVGMMFVYRHDQEDDLDAKATYFFDFNKKPSRIAKVFFILKKSLSSPSLFFFLVKKYFDMHRFISLEALVGAAHGVTIDEAIKVFKPDILLSEAAIVRTFMATYVAKKHNVPIVVDTYAEVHDRSILKLQSETHRKEYWPSLFKEITHIIAPSHYCAKGPLEFASSEKVSVIYAGIELNTYAEHAVAKKNAREKFSLPIDGFYAIAVGSLAARKGHDHMIEAVSKLPADTNTHALICGPGDSAYLREYAQKHGVSDRVHFFTNLSEKDLIQLYSASDVYCDASNTPRACLGMSVTEAMAVGRPVVSYEVGGLPEIVKEGVNGYLVPVNDIEKLSGALLKMKELPSSEYEKLSQGSFALAGELVDIDKTTKAMIEKLDDILAGRI